MQIIKTDNETLLLELTTTEGNIYKKIEKNKVPKSILERIKVGGAAGKWNDWLISNTSGLEPGEYFKKISDRVYFQLENHEQLKDVFCFKNQVEYKKGLEFIKQYVTEVPYFSFTDQFYYPDEDLKLRFSLIIDKSKFIVLKHELEQHDVFNDIINFFKNRDFVNLYLELIIDKEDSEKAINYLEEIKYITKENSRRFREDVEIKEIDDIIAKFNIKGMNWNYNYGEEKFFYGNDNYKIIDKTINQ